MQPRIELAILDHNYNTQCKQAVTKSDLLSLYIINIVLNTSVQGKQGTRLFFQSGERNGLQNQF